MDEHGLDDYDTPTLSIVPQHGTPGMVLDSRNANRRSKRHRALDTEGGWSPAETIVTSSTIHA